MKPHVVKFFQFLEAKEGKDVPFKVKLLAPDDYKIAKDELDVKGNLDLANSDIVSLPNGFKVSRNLILRGCTSLTSLPDGLRVGNDLSLAGCTSLTSLPNNLYIGGYLDLRNTPLAKLYGAYEIMNIIEDTGGYVEEKIYV